MAGAQKWPTCLPSHGRGHWFDPSTAHQIKSGTYVIVVQAVEVCMAAGMADAESSHGKIPMDARGNGGPVRCASRAVDPDSTACGTRSRA